MSGLESKMEERHHTKWLVKKKAVLTKAENMNPRASMGPVVSKRKAMPATTTRLINRIWGEFYSNYSPEEVKEGDALDVKKDDEEDEPEDNEQEDCEEPEEESTLPVQEPEKPHSASKEKKSRISKTDISWVGSVVGKMADGKALYKEVVLR